MGLKNRLCKLIGLSSIALISLSCQQIAADSQAVSEQRKIIRDVNVNIRSNVKVGDDRNELINEDGWKLPSLSSFTIQSKKTIRVKNNNANLKIEQAEYKPNEDVVITADGNTFNNAPRHLNEPDKTWLIRSMKIFAVKEKPFCYFMRGNWVTLDSAGKIEGRAAMTIGIVYLDKDGDGVFESFKYTSFEIGRPPIPEWVEKLK